MLWRTRSVVCSEVYMQCSSGYYVLQRNRVRAWHYPTRFQYCGM